MSKAKVGRGGVLANLAWIAASGLLLASGAALVTATQAQTVAAPPAADAAVCARMGDAMIKTARTPYASQSTITSSKQQPNGSAADTVSHTTETIFTGDAVFVRFGSDHWRRINVAIESLQGLVGKAASRFSNCKDLGVARIESATVMVLSAYDGALSSSYGTQTKLWVDKASGTLVRSETETRSEGGSRHSTIDYRYGNVAAPRLEN